jgi:membrane protease YdiL (CAAX protease family)
MLSRASVPEAVGARRAAPLPPVILLGLFLAVYGNAVSTIMAWPTPLGGATGVTIGLLLIVIVLAWAWWARISWAELGLDRQGIWGSLALGFGVAAATLVPALLIMRFPPVVGEPVSYGPALAITTTDLLLRVLILMPIDTVLPEELAFRGVLLSSLLRRHAAVAAVLLAAVPFTVWHVVIVGRTLGLTNLVEQPLFTALGFAGALIAVFIGGVLFGWLRVKTGHLAGSLAAHWGFNTGLLVGLRLLQTA